MAPENPPVNLQYADVRCRECGNAYVCTPEQDYYNATTTEDGVCFDCLLKEKDVKPQKEEEMPVMGADELIGIRLNGGPSGLDGWTNAYPASELWGWPPPEEIAAIKMGGQVAVAIAENVPDRMKDQMTFYRKIKQSELPAPGPESSYFRGAEYEAVSDE